MLMGMASPANIHKNVNANDYEPWAILATKRLSSFEVNQSTFFKKSFCEGLLPDVYFGSKPRLFTSVEICWFILSVFKIFLLQTGENSVGRRKCNKVIKENLVEM
jgi:hypothetical protein